MFTEEKIYEVSRMYRHYRENKPRPRWSSLFTDSIKFHNFIVSLKKKLFLITLKLGQWFPRRKGLKSFSFGCYDNQTSACNQINFKNLWRNHPYNMPVKMVRFGAAVSKNLIICTEDGRRTMDPGQRVILIAHLSLRCLFFFK